MTAAIEKSIMGFYFSKLFKIKWFINSLILIGQKISQHVAYWLIFSRNWVFPIAANS